VILIINSETGVVLDVNKTLQRALGYTPRQLVGKHYSVLVPPSLSTSSQDLIHAVRYHGAVFESRGFLRADGTVCPMDITATVIPWGMGTAVVATLRDVSERMTALEAQQTAEVLKAELEQEKELNELKSRFVSMVSHEYRTPLATIMTSSELLVHYSDRMSDANKVRHLTQIQQSVKNMLTMMNEVLALEKMNVGQLNFEPKAMDLTIFCATIAAEIDFNTRGVTPIEFTVFGDSRSVCMDESLLRQIVTNLLSNAVKYSSPGSNVDFRLDWGNERAMLTISDHGIGIPEEDQKRLFEPFHRAKNVSDISGTGLGLSIARRAVELHGGTIGFQSQVGIGTTFVVILPIIGDNQCP
jgi:PAS domain S-box-containing protein